MKLAGVTIKAGEEHHINLEVAMLPSRTPITIPVVIVRAKKAGPALLLQGGLHGDEINGIEIVRRIVDNDLHHPQKGTVICIPLLNVFGFLHFSRDVPDGKDVNRSFPGNKNGSLASKVAYTLMKEIMPLIDYGIDFHTGGASRTNYPQIRCALPDERNEMLAAAFNAPYTISAKLIPKSLRAAAHKRQKHIIVFEGGESMRFDEFAIQHGIDGTLRVMQQLGMRKTAPGAFKPSTRINNTKWVRAEASGLWVSKVDAGETVEKGRRLGYVTSPYGDWRKEIISPLGGYVIGLNNLPVVNKGDALVHIGSEKHNHVSKK